ncbi:MAG: thioredoxin-disulfide reductase [Desulfatiglandaceae bacterium]
MHDLVIIGGGPAGLTAGLYAARSKLDAVLYEKLVPGGQILTTDWIENYPGFPEGLSGFDLVDRMKRQAERFGLKIEGREVTSFNPSGTSKTIVTDQGTVEAKAVIYASGAAPRKIGVDGEVTMTGKGVSYCATCDGPFYRDQEVAVIGGGDTAVEEALYLTKFASKVHLIHRRDKLRAVKILQERAEAEKKLELVWDTIPTRIMGSEEVEGLALKNVKSGLESTLPIQGIFVFIGYSPNNSLLKDIVELDDSGFVTTNRDMETSIPGVFAAGDIRSKLLRQVSTAVGEGATAAFAAERYIENL